MLKLCYVAREKFDNIIFFGKWLDNSKPNYNIIFAKALEQLRSLLNKINIIANKRVRIRGQSGLLDLPAKASVCVMLNSLMMNMVVCAVFILAKELIL
jgi:hypothetical protein